MPRIEALPGSAVPLDWRSPIRVGFLLDPASQGLRQEVDRGLDRRLHLRGEARVSGVNRARAFDLLVIPAPLAGARELLLASPAVVRASVLLLLHRSAAFREAPFAEITALCELTLAHGVALVPVDEGREAEWLLTLIENLSRAMSFPGALDDPRFLEARRQVWLFADPILRAARATFRAGPGPTTREAPPIEPLQKPGQDGYSLGVEEDLTRSPTRQERPARPERSESPGRFLQARVEEKGRRHYEIKVNIGPPEAGALMAERAFPEGELPEDELGHQLTVVLSEPNLLDKPEVRTIFLPRDGASSACLFELALPAAQQAVEARITVLYENRVLQTALLTGRAGEPWKLALEMIVRPGMKNLSRQRTFDGALILNHTGDGESRMTAGAGYSFVTFSIAGLDRAVEEIEARINGTPWDDPSFASLEAPGSQELLRYLARKGAGLYRELLRYAPASPLVTGDGPVQVVAAESGARLPIEFVYSRKSPDTTAGICPNWRQALTTGACSCPDDGSVVCPLGFWCFRRVLERHRFRAEHVEITGSRAYALGQAAGDEGRLAPLRSAVLGASERVTKVDSGALERLLSGLAKHLHGPLEPAHGWKDWARRVQTASPSLLILLPHTALDGGDVPTLEIEGDALPSDHLEREHVLGPRGEPNPVVLLFGCNTDNSGLPFEGFVPSFADQQAAVIVTSLAKILGRHAAPLAALFVDQLAAFPNNGEHYFGEVMRDVRRKAALEGFPLALVLKAYGDADWRI